MLNNGNFLGSYDLSKQNWNGGVIDMRSHAAMKYSGRFPEYAVLPDDITVGNSNKVGPYTGKFCSTLTQDTTMVSLFITDDGTKLFTIGQTSDSVFRYDLSTAYDVSTAVYVSTFAFGTTVVDPIGISFSPDGLKMLVLSASTDIIYSYSLSTAWALGTVTYDSKSFTVTTQEATPLGLYVKPDGTKFWIIGSTSDNIREYTMSTPWDISTAVYSTVTLLISTDTAPRGIFWNSTGTKFYVFGGQKFWILVYNAPTPWTLTGATYTGAFAGLTTYSGLVLPNSLPSSFGTAAYLVPGTPYLYMIDYGADKVVMLTNPVSDNITTAAYAGYLNWDQSRTGLTATVNSLYFKPDGSRFWVASSTGLVSEYLCTSPWTVTSATLVRSTLMQMISSATATGGTGLPNIHFSADGLYYYQVVTGTNYLTQWALTKPWDLSSAKTLVYGSSTILAASTGKFTFSKNGNYVYYMSNASQQYVTISRKVLSTPWDLSTAATATSITVSSVIGSGYLNAGIVVSEDGRFLYSATNATVKLIYKFEMTTPWDITTLVFRSDAYIGGLSTMATSIAVDRSGQGIFILDQTAAAVYKFITT